MPKNRGNKTHVVRRHAAGGGAGGGAGAGAGVRATGRGGGGGGSASSKTPMPELTPELAAHALREALAARRAASSANGQRRKPKTRGREKADVGTLETTEVLDLSHRSIANIASLGRALELRKLNLSHNKLAELKGLEHCRKITLLQLAHNQLTRQAFQAMDDMPELAVVNLGFNNVSKIPKKVLAAAASTLKALILNNNALTKVAHVSHLRGLNTLVLSHNKIAELNAKPLRRLTNLMKLSIAHNFLKELPDLSHMPQLAELRLNDNELSALPSSLGQCSLRLLDIGNNAFANWSSVAPAASCKKLANLNLRGNPLCKGAVYGKPGSATESAYSEYASQALAMFAGLTVLDGTKTPRNGSLAARRAARQVVLATERVRTKRARAEEEESDESGRDDDGEGDDDDDDGVGSNSAEQTAEEEGTKSEAVAETAKEMAVPEVRKVDPVAAGGAVSGVVKVVVVPKHKRRRGQKREKKSKATKGSKAGSAKPLVSVADLTAARGLTSIGGGGHSAWGV